MPPESSGPGVSPDPPVTAASALALIEAERRHQIEDCGFTIEYDVARTGGQLADAALLFIGTALGQRDPKRPFPFLDESLLCKPRGLADPIHDLVKAGALIAAEVDRLRAIGVKTHGNEGVWS